jgi:ApaG protein
MNLDQIAKEVHIDTKTRFDRSVILKDETQFVFSYKIRISNNSNRDIQLISRSWVIVNACNDRKTVKGQGVIGKQPILEPGQSFSYSSWCPLNTELGKMHGQYTFKDLSTAQMFNVDIPDFTFQTDFVNS